MCRSAGTRSLAAAARRIGRLALAAATGITALPGRGAAGVPVPARLAATPPAIAARIDGISRSYLGTPYRRDPLGEGPAGDVDRDPLFDRRHVDCVTLVEQVLAEATAAGPQEVPARLRRIRYRDGIVSFRTRNHFTVTDWLPHNAWLVRDITDALAGARARRMVKLIDRKAFLQAHGGDGAGCGRERCATDYVPRADVPALAHRVPPATVAILVQNRPGIIAAHCGWLLRPDGKSLVFRHASSARRRVVDEPFLFFLRRQPRSIVGVKFCVVRGA